MIVFFNTLYSVISIFMSNQTKRAFISVDMEGVSSLVDGTQTSSDHPEYGYYRKLMAEDVNATIEGVLEAGVKEIVVSDAHGGMRNIQPEELHEAAVLVRGNPKPLTMMAGIEDDFDAAMYVGYHAMNGTEKGILAHTIQGSIVDAIYLNGRETGEFGLNAALAGWYGASSVFISGDDAVCHEAEMFVPQISTAVVKWALGRQSAKCLHPSQARKLIKNVAKESIQKMNRIEPFWVNDPIEVKIRWMSPTMADAVSFLPYMDRIDGKTTRALFNDFPTAYKGLRASIWVADSVSRR
jgi:D-amino peptidase